MTEAEAVAAVAELAPVDEGDDDHDHDPLPPEQVAALRLVDVLTEPGTPRIDDELLAELDRHFDRGQLLELATALSVASGWQRFIEAFGIRPDHWTEATRLPPRPNTS